MKKLLALVVLVALAFSGCASGSFLGLATTKYVDEKEKASADQLAAQIEQLKADQAAQVESLKAQIADYESMKQQAQAAIDQMNATAKTVADLQALAKRAEDRIASIPAEVIRQIVDILQAALKK